MSYLTNIQSIIRPVGRVLQPIVEYPEKVEKNLAKKRFEYVVAQNLHSLYQVDHSLSENDPRYLQVRNSYLLDIIIEGIKLNKERNILTRQPPVCGHIFEELADEFFKKVRQDFAVDEQFCSGTLSHEHELAVHKVNESGWGTRHLHGPIDDYSLKHELCSIQSRVYRYIPYIPNYVCDYRQYVYRKNCIGMYRIDDDYYLVQYIGKIDGPVASRILKNANWEKVWKRKIVCLPFRTSGGSCPKHKDLF